MLSEIVDIEELATTDSVAEANRLLQDGWDLIGFHAAPALAESSIGPASTIFVMARLTEFEDEEDVELEEYGSQNP